MSTTARRSIRRALLAGALAAAAPALGAPATAHAQWNEHHSTHDDGNRRLELSMRGKVWFTDDDRDIERLEPGGRLMIEERVRFGPERMLIITGAQNGEPQRTYLVDGQARDFDAAAQTWLHALLPEIIRETGVGAEERVKRIFSQRGVSGVLDEIELIKSSSNRRLYLTTLMTETRLNASEGARALRAAGRISSSSSKADVLVRAADRLPMQDAGVRQAYVDAARSISSSSELRRALTRLLEDDSLQDDVLRDALRVAGEISSSSERATVLVLAAQRQKLSSDELRTAFFNSTESISSSSEKRRVLVSLLRAQGTDKEVVRGVVRTARSISSDSEKAAVLMEVPSLQLKDTTTVRVYLDAADTIRSRSSRNQVTSRIAVPAWYLE
jgi:hypothetical protein